MSLTDWFSLGTAIGTLALAAATFYMARRTSALAEETRDGIDASSTQFRQERMPVVMPLGEMLDRVEEASQGKLPWPRYLDEQKQAVRLFVPTENVGAGPAIDISADIFWLDQFGSRSISSTQPMVTRSAVLPALGPGGRANLAFEFRGLAVEPMMAFRLTMTYKDGAGGAYKVTADFFPATMSYGPMYFEPPEELRLPGSKPKQVPLPEGYERVLPPEDVSPDPILGGDEGIYS